MKFRKVLKTMGLSLLLGTVGFSNLVGCSNTSEPGKDIIPEIQLPSFSQQDNSIVKVVSKDETKISFYSTEPTVINEENSVYVEQTVTATILPDDAPNKDVTWELSWETESEEDVSEYVTITPSESDSKILTLRCFKPFLDKNMILLCKTVLGGFSAYATVTYYGMPSDFNIESDFDKTNDSSWGVEYYSLGVGNNYDFSIDLKNVFDCINTNYESEFSVLPIGYGSIIAKKSIMNSDELRLFGEKKLLSDNPILETRSETEGVIFLSRDIEDYPEEHSNDFEIATYSLIGNTLSINIKNAVEAFSDDNRFYFNSYVGNKPCYFALKITEKNLDVTHTFMFRATSSVQGVTLSLQSVQF